jgi:hypothetical protein
MKSRSASEWVKAYDTIHQELTYKGFKPKLQTLDNKVTAALKNCSPSTMSITNWCRLTAVKTSGKAGAQIPHLPLGDDSSPWGR